MEKLGLIYAKRAKTAAPAMARMETPILDPAPSNSVGGVVGTTGTVPLPGAAGVPVPVVIGATGDGVVGFSTTGVSVFGASWTGTGVTAGMVVFP